MVFFSLLPYTTIFDAIPITYRTRLLVRPTRKVRFSVTSPVQNAPFGHVAVASPVQNALLRESDTPRVRFYVRPSAQNAPLREVAPRLRR